MKEIIIAAVTAIVASVICCNISAIVTFQVIDKYVEDMIEKTKELLWDTRINK